MNTRTFFLSTIPILFAVVAAGQVTTDVNPDLATGLPRMGAITGAPYSADEVSEHTQTLADGTHISKTNSVVHLYRDSAGRTRTERQAGPPGRSASMMIEIRDPVAGFQYTFDSQIKVAHRFAILHAPPRPPPPPPPGGASTSKTNSIAPAITFTRAAPANRIGDSFVLPRPQVSSETLESQVIEGVVATGRRTTSTWPAGSQGNDRPIAVISEIWISPELNVTVLSKDSDPRSGENTTKLINISRAEPDSSLFQPPLGYQIVDQPGEEDRGFQH